MSNYLEHRRKLKGIYTGDIKQIIEDKPQPKSLNKKKKPATRSKKLAKEMTQYVPEMKQYLMDNPVCALNLPECTVQASCVHHTAGRSGKQLRNQKDWTPSCHSCNGKVETIGKKAYDTGLKKKRNGKAAR